MTGDDDMICSILNSGTNPNIQDVCGYTALHYAFKSGQLSCISHLLCHSEDPIGLLQVPSNDGTTALSIQSETSGESLLHFACKWKDEFVLQVLLEAGADPNAKDNSGLTPLMNLVLSGVVSSSTSDMIYALHSHGCNLNAALEVNETNLELQPWNGWTALHMAVGKQLENVDSDCIKSLISCGASIQATDTQGRTLLHIACIAGYFDNLYLLPPKEDHLLIKDEDTVQTDGDKEGGLNLHHACMIGDDDVICSILNSGTNPNIQDVYGCTALHYAFKTGQLARISRLLCHSEDPIALLQVPSNDGTTPLSIRSDTSGETLLHFACKCKDEFVLQVLLEAGADPNVNDISGLTPLMSLVLSSVLSSSTSDMVDALHSYGCNLNAALEVSETNLELQLWNGSTALHMAIGIEKVDSGCIKSLISCGAYVQATDAQGRTPLHIACIVGYFDNLDLLAPNEDYFQTKDSSGCIPLYYVCRYGHCEYFRKVLSHYPKNLLQAVNTDGATPLTVVDVRGRTILHQACREGYDDVTIDLLEADVDPSIKDSQGYTPLHYACENGHDKCIHALLYSSMDPSGLPEIKDANGRIPLHIACMQQHHHLIKALEPSHEHFLIEDNDGYTPLYYICIQRDCLRLTEICHLSKETPGILSLLTAKVTADGASPLTIVDEEGRAVIHHVCKKGDEDLTLRLLKTGADPTVQDSQGYTPLHYACEGGHIKCLNHLLDYCQNSAKCLNIMNNHGISALHMNILAVNQNILHLACQRKDIYVIKKFLEAGANASLTDGFGFTPLMRVLIGKAVHGNDALDQFYDHDLLYESVPGSESSGMIQSSSTRSMGESQSFKGMELIVSCIEHLISFGASLEAQDAFGRSALHIACIFGHSALLHLLTPNGDFHHMLTKDSSGCTPLYYLYNLGHCQCSRNILAEFPTSLQNTPNGTVPTHLTAVDEEGQTLLHYVCRKGNLTLTADLLKAGADPTVQDTQGNTPLHYVCERDLDDIFFFNHFISKYSYSHTLWQIPNNKGVTPLCMRASSGQTVLHLACQVCDGNLWRNLLKAGADPRIQDSQGNTPLHFACERGDIEHLGTFLDCCDNPIALLVTQNNKGASPMSINVKTTEGDQTILHLACQKKDICVIKRLLEAGANANLPDGFGFTPLMRVLIGKAVNSSDVLKQLSASQSSMRSQSSSTLSTEGSQTLTKCKERELCVSCTELLISFGASLEVQDAFGRSALHIACISGHSALLHFLAPNGDFRHMLTKDSSGCTPLYYLYNLGHCACSRNILAQFPTSLQTAPTDTAPTHLTAVDEEGQTLLHYACRKGYISLTADLLEAGADPTVQDSQGNTPLHYACERSSILYLKHFIDKCSYTLWKIPNNKGVTPRYVKNSSNGQTVLHLACQMCDSNLIRKLLEAGADPWIQDNQGYTPLHYACKRGDIYCLNTFFLCCQDPNTLFQIPNDSDVTPLSMLVLQTGRTLLHLACEKQDSNLVRKFLEAGADPNAIDTSGFTPLMRVITLEGITDYKANYIITILCQFNCDITLTLRKLMPSKNITESSTLIWEGTALHMAAKVGSKPLCVQTLTAQCTNAVDIRDTHGRIPLHIATLYGHHNLINFLAPHPEYFLVKDDSGCTPLYYACKDGNYQCIRGIHQQITDDVILEQCIQVANIDGITPLTVKDANGRTILHHALLEGDGNLACKLLRAGADPTEKDYAGITPFIYKSGTINMKYRTLLHHLCCEDGNFDLILELLQAGADSNAQDGNGYTPLMLALRYINDTDASRILLASCDVQHELSDCVYSTVLPHSALHIATEYNKTECVKFLITKGADLLAKNSNGKNPLHIACIKGYSNLVGYLLTDKSIEVKDITGSTPLHYACKYGHIECVRKIIRVMENDHLKALFQITNLEGVTPLKGTNSQGETILHHTCAAHDLSLVQDLLRYGACPNAQDNAGLTPLMTALKVNKQTIDSEKLLQLAKTLVSSVSWDPHIKDSQRGWTVLHYAAGYEDVRINYTLLVAGCDASVEDNDGQTFSNLMPRKSLQALSKELLRIDRRQIVCVIGYPNSGKTTLIAAYKQVPRGTLQRVSIFFQTNRITLTDTRTAGIETTTLSDDKLGNIIFFDFAGQSEYYVSHLAFLESALAPKGAAITFIMVVDLRLVEDEKFRQCMEWLFPIKSIVNKHNVLNVVLIGSHQDQLKSGSSTTAKQSLYTTMQKLKTTLSTPCLHFIDCWGMDCRRSSSKGMARLQEYLKSGHSSCNSDEGRYAPLGASLLFHNLKHLDNPPLAITPCMIIDRLKDGHHPFPLTVNYIDSCCQDLSAAGIVLYFLDREDASKSWLILEIEEILSRIHGKLFAPDNTDFPMHHKNLANQFGLVQTGELKVAFKHSLLDPDMVQRLLMSMEFCHPIDSSLMKEGTNSMHIGLEIDKDVVEGQLSFFLNKAEFRNNWLFFPSLVKVDRGITMSMEFDVSPEDCHSVCWELSTVTPHFLTPRFQQAIFIRLTCNYVQKHKSVLSSVEEHSCAVSKNAMSWSTMHGVDVCVQIKYKSIVNVTARSRPGVEVSFLMELIANVVSDILTARANHSPGVDVFSVLRVMDKGTPTDHTVPISSIIASVEENGSHVNCREQPLKLISLKDLFLDWEVSTTLLKKMNNIMGSTPVKMDFSTTPHVETPTENEHTQQSTDDVNQSGLFKGTSC